MNKDKLTLGSLFDGSGGFPLGGILTGIEPKWSSEIEPFPVLVTHKRLPEVKHYGDVSGLSGAELEPVDIITFGSPCQDLSIAGKRAGIQDGERSNLFFQAVRIIKEMREATHGEKPRYCVWENVPGAFSSNGGADFKAVLEAVIGIKEEGVQVPAPEGHRWPKADVYLGDGWSVAYRVLDAQYWGVPQRRARIYLVCDLGGESAGEILFKSEGMSGYSPEGCRPWERASGGAEEGTGEAGGRPDPGDRRYVLNPQGCSGIRVTEEQTGTLVAQDHGNHPAVLQAAGFSTEHSAQSRSIGYEEETSPTLRAGVVPAALSIENHPTDGRVKVRDDGKVQTLCERAGTGGGNVPLVGEPVTLKIRSGCEGGGKGALWQENKSATLGTHNDQTLFQPQPKSYGISKEAYDSGEKAAFNFSVYEELSPTLIARQPGAVAKSEKSIAYGICSKSSHAMMSDNPHSGFYEAKTSRTLDRSGGNAVTSNQGGICIVSPVPEERETYDVRFTSEGSKVSRGHVYPSDTARTLGTDKPDPGSNQGGIAVLEKETSYALQGSMIGRTEKNCPQGDGVNEDVSFTLNTVDRHAVAHPEDVHYSTSKNSYHTSAIKEQAGTLVATDYKDPPCVNDMPNDEPAYIVRRLTPTECAHLQGFPDWWCRNLAVPEPSEDEVTFWMEVWETWNSINGKRPKTEKQVRKWLADPYTDAAEYKLWGNGISLPIVYFVLSGIAWAAGKEKKECPTIQSL